MPARRLLLAAIALVAVAGCTPQLAVVGPAVAPPRLAESAVATPDGARLPVRVWLPADRSPRAAIVALHGFNDYSNAYDKPARDWAKQGIATYAYDQRGFGAAPNTYEWVGAQVLADDALTVARLVRQAHPGIPLILMGESMGGAVAIVAASAVPPHLIDGVVLLAPAVWGRASMNVVQRVGLWLFAHTLATTEVTGSGLGIVASDNREALEELRRDPLVLKGARIGTVYGLVDLMDRAVADLPRLMLPTLILYGKQDQIVPPDPTCAMFERLPARPPGQWRAALYPNGYHLLLRDLSASIPREDIAAWIRDQSAPLPSGDEIAAPGPDDRPGRRRVAYCEGLHPVYVQAPRLSGEAGG